MPILITGVRTSLEKLADELLTSRASDAQRAEAIRALRAANPGLSGRIAAGTPVVLPDLPHRRARVEHVGTIAGAGALDDVGQLLEPLPAALAARAAALKSRAAAMRGAAEAALEVIDDAQLKRFLTKARAEAANERGRAESAAAEALAAALADAAPRWAGQLDALKALLLRVG